MKKGLKPQQFSPWWKMEVAPRFTCRSIHWLAPMQQQPMTMILQLRDFRISNFVYNSMLVKPIFIFETNNDDNVSSRKYFYFPFIIAFMGNPKKFLFRDWARKCWRRRLQSNERNVAAHRQGNSTPGHVTWRTYKYWGRWRFGYQLKSNCNNDRTW